MSLYFSRREECTQHQIFPGVRIHTLAAERTMLSLVEFAPHAVVERHAHPHEQVGMVLSGRAHFYVGEEDRVLGAGDLYRIPGNIPHRVVALNEPVQALDFFHPVREDYR